jgi:hypothetical protein
MKKQAKGTSSILERGSEHQKSERRKYFLDDQNVENHFVENMIKNHFIEKNVKSFGSFSSQKYFQCSDFTYGVRKDQNIENQKEQLPMAYYLCVPRPVGC